MKTYRCRSARYTVFPPALRIQREEEMECVMKAVQTGVLHGKNEGVS